MTHFTPHYYYYYYYYYYYPIPSKRKEKKAKIIYTETVYWKIEAQRWSLCLIHANSCTIIVGGKGERKGGRGAEGVRGCAFVGFSSYR